LKRLHLSAVRLVGFHNFEDVLIPVRGDLFVVGANESGKTTILDAVHLALSGEQDFDWNAAASLTGPKPSGRSFQGIILRADLAGQARRQGGSIAYVVAELRSAGGEDGQPLSLVLGAAATDMHTQVLKWAAIIARPATELPLTDREPGGTQRILDRDTFEARVNCRIHKGNRGVGDFRTAVADRLFAGRGEFDDVTRLWKTAKSYRELARTARNIGEVVRHVLPAPDPEPFQRIAKGFRDIAEIEEDLKELTRDVEALHGLRTMLVDARDARESLRRYRYVQATWRERDLRDAVQRQGEARQAAAEQATALAHDAEELESRISLAKERLANLRESDSYKLVASLEATEERLAEADRRVGRLSEQLKEHKSRLADHKRERDLRRTVANSAIRDARNVLAGIAQCLLDMSAEAVADILQGKSHVPETVDSICDAGLVKSAVDRARQRLALLATGLEDEIRSAEQTRDAAKLELDETTVRLRRLEQYDDLIPALPGLDEALARLSDQCIGYRLLYQALDWTSVAAVELQAAAEAAFGLPRLATIIVSPENIAAARQIVLETGGGLRILDAAPVRPKSPATRAGGHQRLLDFVVSKDSCVAAHLLATVGDVLLSAEPPTEGADLVWFAVDGAAGERGARWRLPSHEACWIGEQRRRKVRHAKIAELRDAINRLELDFQGASTRAETLRTSRSILHECVQKIDDLRLPWSIQTPCTEFRRAHEAVHDLEEDINSRQHELEVETRQQDQLSQSKADLRKQIQGTDGQTVKKQVDKLETQKSGWEGELVGVQADVLATKKEIEDLDRQITKLANEVADAVRQAGSARNSLVAVLAEPHTSNLDRYVFDTKRGGQLKEENLDEKIRSMDRQEAELLGRLRGADGVMNDKLATRYGFRMEDDDALLSIRDRADCDLDRILEERREQERQMQESLNTKTRELFETIFARDLIERLRADLMQLRRTVSDINRRLAPLVFGHSRFQLNPRPIAEHRKLVDLIERQAMPDSESRVELRHYVEDRRDQLMVEGDVPEFLDYRFWFDYNLRLDHVSRDSGPSLGSEDMVRGSVGAQTTHNYLLLLALSALLFDRCKARLRLLMLDDAFYGLDTERKELLLRCGKQLDLDFVVATPDLDGTIQEHAGDSTTVLVEKNEDDTVSVLPFEWERLQEQGQLFPEPRPEAVLGRSNNS
jgi:hypothetical protein